MITLITGAPGAGKTAACVQLLQQFEKEGRAIFVDGIPDLTITHLELASPSKWHEEVPDGAVIVIDEVQRVWRPQAAGKTVPPDISALETHRHKGIEFVLMTQHPSLLHANVRRLVGRHVHLRDLGFLGRHWYEWPECASPEGWKNATIKKRYRLPKQVFKRYKSASLHVKPVRSLPPALVVFALALPIAGYLAYRAYARVGEMQKPNKTQVEQILGAPTPTTGSTSAGEKQPGLTSQRAKIDEPEQQPARQTLVGCIQLLKRCECFDDQGFSVTVELKTCRATSERGGLGVPYDVRGATRHAAAKRGDLPSASHSRMHAAKLTN